MKLIKVFKSFSDESTAIACMLCSLRSFPISSLNTLRSSIFELCFGYYCKKMHLLTLWPWPLNPKTVLLLVYPKVVHYNKFEHFGIICFWVMLLTNRQTDGLENPTHIVDVRNNNKSTFLEWLIQLWCRPLVLWTIHLKISPVWDWWSTPNTAATWRM